MAKSTRNYLINGIISLALCFGIWLIPPSVNADLI